MIATTLPAPDTARLAAASGLQKLLPELVALSLDAKQAHWNMTGPAFLPLHALTDDIAADTRAWADRIAERAVALGFYVDARPSTVAAAASSFPLGRSATSRRSPSSSSSSTASPPPPAAFSTSSPRPTPSVTTSPSTSSKDWRSTDGCSPPKQPDHAATAPRPANGSTFAPAARHNP